MAAASGTSTLETLAEHLDMEEHEIKIAMVRRGTDLGLKAVNKETGRVVNLRGRVAAIGDLSVLRFVYKNEERFAWSVGGKINTKEALSDSGLDLLH